ncbi:tautomerase family protein [Azospira restricta]|uniref:Tautomerase family protein n=1 Tax=Azospira restricta TaxID=404405 RepID=A0A974SNX2_9RHOO|nr:tautomerase family protein [Azospira restricta]QRJ63748.1 tautomerase family protein [Azospira restricta]
MPLVRIDLNRGSTPEFRARLGSAVYRAMVETMNVPENDRFQVIAEREPGSLIYDPSYLGIKRSDRVIFIQVTLNAGRTVELKKAFYARVAELLGSELGVRGEDVFINLVEVAKENWSFGHGVAQYAS